MVRFAFLNSNSKFQKSSVLFVVSSTVNFGANSGQDNRNNTRKFTEPITKGKSDLRVMEVHGFRTQEFF